MFILNFFLNFIFQNAVAKSSGQGVSIAINSLNLLNLLYGLRFI